VLFHLWPHAVPGGFTGVDVFFAISGYLITGQLVREVDRRGRVSLAAFWARRARRLLPAALLVVLVCCAGTAAFVPVTAWDQFFAELRASAGYVQNWHLAGAAVDYFRADDAPSPVRHFWSLSAEEQFYALWPLLVLGGVAVAQARRRRGIAWVLGVTTVASLVCGVWMTIAEPAVAYFATPARAWEFGAGGLLALAPRTDAGRPVVRAALSWLGLAAIVVGALTLSARTAFPGWAALLPIGGALAVIRAGTPARRWAPTGLLRRRVLQWLGDQSYSIYLWHWPLLIFAPFVLGRGVPVLVLAVTLLLAWATKRWVEDPVRRAPVLVRRAPGWSLGAAAVATGAVVGVTLVGSGYVDARIARDEQVTQKTLAHKPPCFGAAAHDPARPCVNERLRGMVVPTPVEAPKMPNSPCRMLERDRRLRVCAFGTPAPRAVTEVAVVGDSHASHWRPALAAVARRRGWRGLSLTRTGCPFTQGSLPLDEPVRTHCAQWNDQALGWLVAHRDIGTVIVAAHAGAAVTARGYMQAWRPLLRAGKRIVVLRDTPTMRVSTLACVQDAIDQGRAPGVVCAVPRSFALDTGDPQVEAAARIDSPRVDVVDLTDLLCGPHVCPPVIGGALAFKDEDHFTPPFAATLAPALDRALGRVLG
jgi:peptidoglycan/LPS O-acetylase OafA/YrhL